MPFTGIGYPQTIMERALCRLDCTFPFLLSIIYITGFIDTNGLASPEASGSQFKVGTTKYEYKAMCLQELYIESPSLYH